MKRIQLEYLLFSAIIAALFLTAAGAPRAVDAQETAQGEYCTALPATREVTLTAFTRARKEMSLVTETAGRVDEVFADIGEAVGKGGRFACVDDAFTRLDLENNRVEQGRLSSRMGYFSKEAGRYRKLVQTDTAAQSALDRLEQDLDQARLELKALQVQEKILLERISRSCVKAPEGWRVTERDVEPGQWVDVGERLGAAADFTTLLTPFAFSPEEYARLEGMDGSLSLHFPNVGADAPARIERIHPGFDEQTRKIAVDLAVSDGLPVMRGGLRAELRLQLPDESGAVLVPAAAVKERYEEHWMVRDNGDRVKVLVLGKGPGNTLRVVAEAVCSGESFRIDPAM